MRYNPANFTIYTLADETYGFKVNGTYIYEIEKKTLSTGSITRATLTIIMSLAKLSSATSLINIDKPFEVWYELNKNKIPFYAPPTPTVKDLVTGENQSAISEILSTDELKHIIEVYGQEATNDLNTWSLEEILRAYEEARQRLTKPVIPISVKAKLDSVGLLAIKFNVPIAFPSYLIKEFAQKSQARALGSSLFWSDNGFEKNELSGARSSHTQVIPTSTGSVTGSLTETLHNLVPPTDSTST